MGACREMRLPRSESESQSMSPFSGALDSTAAAAPAPAAGQSSSTSTEDRCFAGFALSGVKSYAGGSSASSSFSSARDTAAAGFSLSESESGGGGRLPASSLYDDARGFCFFVPPVARPVYRARIRGGLENTAAADVRVPISREGGRAR